MHEHTEADFLNTAENGPRERDQVHSLLTSLIMPSFLITQNALLGCTLSALITKEKRERGGDEAPGGVYVDWSPAISS